MVMSTSPSTYLMADPKNQRKHIYGKLKVPKQFWDIMTPFEDSAVVDPSRQPTLFDQTA